MIVVADTAPLSYLVQIDCEQSLSRLFTRVFIPSAVWQELRDENTPAVVQRWAERLPTWMEVRCLHSAPNKSLMGLYAGERDAIQLAHEVKADLLLIDERAGTRIAREQGLIATGTLGVLLDAAQQESFPLNEALNRLAKTNQLSPHISTL